MALKPQEAYLHLITMGKYDNDKRRAVRQLFSTPQKEEPVPEEESNKVDNMDIAVGILEEFHAINVPTFALEQAIQVISIFGLGKRFPDVQSTPGELTIVEAKLKQVEKSLRECFNSPFLQLSSGSEDNWVVPPESQIEKLLRRFCKFPEQQAAEENPNWRSMAASSHR